MRATLSILGLYDYRPDIFDGFSVPAGVEKDVLFPELLSECSELEILYSDPDILKSLITAWSKRRLYSWTKLYKTTQLEYNPIYNKDGTVEETETRTLDSDQMQTRNLETAADYSATSNNVYTDEHQTYGYNSTTGANSGKDFGNSTDTGNSSSSGKDTGTIHNDRDDVENIERTRHEYGNIGVTTTQKMIQEERDISDFDIYNIIVTDFKQRFCLLVY